MILLLFLFHVEKCPCIDRCTILPISIARLVQTSLPPSPQLLFLAIEPLAEAVIASHLVLPAIMDQHVYFISLYADDILLYLSKVKISFNHILIPFKHLKTSLDIKLIVWHLNNCPSTLQPNPPSTWTVSTYSGIKLLPTISDYQ